MNDGDWLVWAAIGVFALMVALFFLGLAGAFGAAR